MHNPLPSGGRDSGLAPPSPRRNIELKARCSSLRQARTVAEELGATRAPDQHQVDTYFHCRDGRLKLREIAGQAAQLIWYSRPDDSGPKPSQYYVVPVESPHLLKRALQSALGIRAIVDKYRVIYLYRNVRIHLDDVRGLGTFVEFEAVLDDSQTDETGHRLVEDLQLRLQILPADLLTRSYGEMVAQQIESETEK